MSFDCAYCGTHYQSLHNCPNCGAPARKASMSKYRDCLDSPITGCNPAFSSTTTTDFFTIEAERIRGDVERRMKLQVAGPFLVMPHGMGHNHENVVYEKST